MIVRDAVDPAVRARIVVVAWMFVILFCVAFWSLAAHYSLTVWHHSKGAKEQATPSSMSLQIESK